jgi:indolepyruvate ferredoxin oxidoreductase alpha subunit
MPISILQAEEARALMTREIKGGEAIAYGALAAGVSFVGSYPGSPSSEVVEAILRLPQATGIDVEWASNEGVALETAIGVSIAGRRALVCTKSVGMNVLVDPLMTLSLTPLNAGIVIVLGDDPGGYGSQNDQDTRPIAVMAEMPLLEPATPAGAYRITREAFELSERFGLPVIIRETRSFAQFVGPVVLSESEYAPVTRGLAREPWRYVPVPRNVVAKHRDLHERLSGFAACGESAGLFQSRGDGEVGVLAAGFAARKFTDVLGPQPIEGLKVAELELLHPLPEHALGAWLSSCRELLVLEETEPFIERALRGIAYERAPGTRIVGKLTGLLSPEGELFRSEIRQALGRWQPGVPLPLPRRAEGEEAERPRKEGYCAGCRYDEVLQAIDEVAAARGERPILVGDPGCLVTVAERLDAKYAIGSAIGVGHGLLLGGVGENVIALFGDSAFFHSAIPALCHAAAVRSPLLLIVLDNQSTLTSGGQPHPGVGRDARGRAAPKLSIERIARSCDVPQVRRVKLGRPAVALKRALEELWNVDFLRLIVVEIPEG